ncbi:MAG: hypothetical protein Q8N76_04595 [Candidatus Omnitrophota bacterium]|nr:hypothetical protein [Candidatus Omnitrophota bacterium]
MREWKKPQLIVLVRNIEQSVLTACKSGGCSSSVRGVDGGCDWVREYDYELGS